jgi:glycosyltransferase involved in cell wall biosynthesis
MGAKQGLDVVLDAAASSPEVTWVLQGDGSERRHLAAEATARGLDNVVFLPTLDTAALADLLAAADVLVLTQRDTVTDMSLPSKLTTYATAGRPIVASVNPASEAAGLIDEGALGTTVPAGEGDALAAAVRSAPGMVDSADAGRLFGSPSAVLSVLAEVASPDREPMP